MQILDPGSSKHGIAPHLLAALCMLPLISACSPSNDQPPAKLFKEQRDVLDKAKAVEDLHQKQNEEQQKALEKQAQ